MERRRGTKYATSCLDNSSSNDSTYDSQQETESNCGDSDEEYAPSVRGRKVSGKRLATSSGKENGVQRGGRRESVGKVNRLPTRRPDPNVFNRNALMARENRRKKKELMEQLEREVMELREKSKKLHKSLFKQSVTIKNLRQENKYLQSVIGNQTEIVKLLKTLNSTRLPISSSLEKQQEIECVPRRGFPSPDSSTPVIESVFKEELEDDSGDDCLNMQLSPCSNLEEWDEMYPLGFDKISDLQPESSDSANRVSINSEHNYFNQQVDHKNAGVDLGPAGVCLHVASGKVSLEFCASCHLNAASTWMLED
uniref:BZIP domain-containing protein n=1 Tax=Phlebotomus papatasi TaxID=29031 RepID=A0A1B0EXS9_PHLPP